MGGGWGWGQRNAAHNKLFMMTGVWAHKLCYVNSSVITKSGGVFDLTYINEIET